MSDLAKKKCVACDGNSPPFDTTEIHKYLKKVDGWDVKNDENKNFYLIKDFKFKNFAESQNFINQVSTLPYQWSTFIKCHYRLINFFNIIINYEKLS